MACPDTTIPADRSRVRYRRRGNGQPAVPVALGSGSEDPLPLLCQTASMLTLPDTPCVLVLRTDFSDEGAWDAVYAASIAPSVDGFAASLSFVSDPAFADLSCPLSSWQRYRR